jgi:hypothetical protein
MNATVMTLARYYALRDLRTSMRAQGLRPFDVRDLQERARDYLKNNPGLIAQAAEAVERDPVLRGIAEREGRRQ